MQDAKSRIQITLDKDEKETAEKAVKARFGLTLSEWTKMVIHQNFLVDGDISDDTQVEIDQVATGNAEKDPTFSDAEAMMKSLNGGN